MRNTLKTTIVLRRPRRPHGPHRLTVRARRCGHRPRLALVGGSYWFSDLIAIRAHAAVPVDEANAPDYHRIVRELTQRAELPMPKLHITPKLNPTTARTIVEKGMMS